MNERRYDFPKFDMVRLLRTVFRPIEGQKICILIDLESPHEIEDFRFIKEDDLTIQRHAYEDFYLGLKSGGLAELNAHGGDIFAYKVTGGSNLDLPNMVVDPAGNELSLEHDICSNYGIVLCISTFSATAPLTAFAKHYGFRGATLHGVNDIIKNSGLAVDYEEVSRVAERIRQGLTRAELFEINFKIHGEEMSLKLFTEGQEAQKSHGLCQGDKPDVANLPAGEVYFVPTSAEGKFPLYYDDGTIGILEVSDGRVQRGRLLRGNQFVIDEHNIKLEKDPATGIIGELGFGTQDLPISGRDIQDEKIIGTFHVATGRSDHLGGNLAPAGFVDKKNATHDDILFAPHKTPDVEATVRMRRQRKYHLLIDSYRPSSYINELL